MDLKHFEMEERPDALSKIEERRIELDRTIVYEAGDATDSTWFRIPFLWQTAKGSLIAGTDANFGSNGDSAENIDVAIRRKERAVDFAAGEGWEDAFLPEALHFLDYSDEPGWAHMSASLIDGVIAEDRVLGTGKLFIWIDIWAWNGGLFPGPLKEGDSPFSRLRTVPAASGFCLIEGKEYLLLSSRNNKAEQAVPMQGINMNIYRSGFDHVCDMSEEALEVHGAYPVYELIGIPEEQTEACPIPSDENLSLGRKTDYSLDAEWNLYRDGEAIYTPQKSVSQGLSGEDVPMKVFYEDSIFQVLNTSYLAQFSSLDDGKTWQSEGLISGQVKKPRSRAYILGPGRALQVQKGAYAGRLIVPVYYQRFAKMQAEVIYSDDAGKTWQAGESIPCEMNISEAAPVEMPDGSLKIFVRNAMTVGGRIMEATSHDGGQSWHDVKPCFDDRQQGGVNCQLSALVLKQRKVFAGDETANPVILLATPSDRNRYAGRVYVGKITPEQEIVWQESIEITGEKERYAYSCLEELDDGRIALMYESSPDDDWNEGLKRSYYLEFRI